MVKKLNDTVAVIDLAPADAKKYFVNEAKKIVRLVTGVKETVQQLTIDAMAHADKHGDWTSTLLPIMEVMLTQGSGRDATHGPFGQQMGLSYARYITQFTKLVYNPRGLNGRKLAKLPIQERWQWDKSKIFDVEAAMRTKWWTIGRTGTDREDLNFLEDDVFDAKVNRFVESVRRIFNETDGMTEELFEARRAAIIDKLEKLKFSPKAGKTDSEADGRTGTENPKRVVDEQPDGDKDKVAA